MLLLKVTEVTIKRSFFARQKKARAVPSSISKFILAVQKILLVDFWRLNYSRSQFQRKIEYVKTKKEKTKKWMESVSSKILFCVLYIVE